MLKLKFKCQNSNTHVKNHKRMSKLEHTCQNLNPFVKVQIHILPLHGL